MIPLQDIDIHTDKNVFYKVHIVAPTEKTPPFFTEVLVYDSEIDTPFQSNVTFRQQFNNAKDAFEHALKWVRGYSAKHGYTINRINNPCNCEFLSKAEQQTIVSNASLSLEVQVNGV